MVDKNRPKTREQKGHQAKLSNISTNLTEESGLINHLLGAC